MKRSNPLWPGLLLAAALAFPVTAPAHGGGSGGGDIGEAIAKLRRATAPFLDLRRAEAAGYAQFLDCTAEPGHGAMGVHYLNGGLVEDAELDPLRPEALMYEPQPDGRMALVGVEFIVFQEAWDALHPQPPVLYGHPFHLVRSPNRYGVPAFYELHLWIWKPNPNGRFNDWNPRVHCP